MGAGLLGAGAGLLGGAVLAHELSDWNDQPDVIVENNYYGDDGDNGDDW